MADRYHRGPVRLAARRAPVKALNRRGYWTIFHQLHHSPARIEILTSCYRHPLEILANRSEHSGSTSSPRRVSTSTTPTCARHVGCASSSRRPSCTRSLTSLTCTDTIPATCRTGTGSSVPTRTRPRQETSRASRSDRNPVHGRDRGRHSPDCRAALIGEPNRFALRPARHSTDSTHGIGFAQARTAPLRTASTHGTPMGVCSRGLNRSERAWRQSSG